MIYRIFSNGRGVITSRSPSVIKDKLELEFCGAPEGATAVVTVKPGERYYRKLKEGKCEVPAKELGKSVEVALAVMDGAVPIARWKCESIKAFAGEGGSFILCPDDAEVYEAMILTMCDLDDVRRENALFKERLSKLEESFEDLKSGYNIV